jgi:hypothetical protein
MAGLLFADRPYLSDRLVGFLGAHSLRCVGVSEAPAHYSIVRLRKTLSVWSPAEVAFGLLIGAVGTLALKAGASTQVDYDALINAVFFGLIPIVCGIAGFVIGRQQPDSVAATCAAMTSFLIGAVLWAAARPLLVEVGLPGNMSGWRHVITGVVVIDGIFAVALAALGQLARPQVEVLSD